MSLLFQCEVFSWELPWRVAVIWFFLYLHMQLENTRFILLVLFYLNSVGLIPLQSGLFDVSPWAKYCWMLQHNMLYGKEWKTQEQAVALVAFPAIALLLLSSIVFCCGIVMRLHWQEARTSITEETETTLTSSLCLSSTNCPLLIDGLMPTHLHSFSGSSLPHWFILGEEAPINKRQTSQHCFHIGKCYFSR